MRGLRAGRTKVLSQCWFGSSSHVEFAELSIFSFLILKERKMSFSVCSQNLLDAVLKTTSHALPSEPFLSGNFLCF